MSPRSRGSAARVRGGDLSRSPKVRRESKTIYVVAEGEGTEYDYFDHVNRHCKGRGPWLKSPPDPTKRNGLKPAEVVDEGIGHLTDEHIDEVWALFDHDARPDAAIDSPCARARKNGIEVALSHPAFELWLLLHFQDVSAVTFGGDNREIMKWLRKAHPEFADYREGNKRIGTARFNALRADDGIRKAMRRARLLDASCAYPGCGNAGGGHVTQCMPSHRDPSTGVWRLIERLSI